MLKVIFGICLVGYSAILIGMFVYQRNLQYFPSNRKLSPDMVGISGATVEKLTTPDGEKINVWYSPAEAENPTILYFHGNGGEIGDRTERLQFYRALGWGVTFVSYRGYGGSSGTPTEQGLVTDANTAYDWLITKSVDPHSIVVVGESLGTGVAVQLAASRIVGALALEAPYSSTADVAAKVYWWLPVRLLMKDQFRSVEHIKNVKVPLLIGHGDADTIIPLEFGKKLFEAANEPKEMVVMPGIGHNDLFVRETWVREIAFFERVLKK